MSDKAKLEMDAAWEELSKAFAEVTEAERAEAAVRTNTSNARNRLNRAQKQWDVLNAKLRDAAPWDTEWHRQKSGASHA